MIQLKDNEILGYKVIKTNREVMRYGVGYNDRATSLIITFKDSKIKLELLDECAKNLTNRSLQNYFRNVDFSLYTKVEFLRKFVEDAKQLFYCGLGECGRHQSVELISENLDDGEFYYQLFDNVAFMEIKGRKNQLELVKEFIESSVPCLAHDIQWREGEFIVVLYFTSLAEYKDFYNDKPTLLKKLKEGLMDE